MTALAVEVGRALRAPDRVVLAILLLFVALALLAPDQAAQSLGFTVQSLIEIAPFLAASVAMAAGARATGADALIGRAFQNRAAIGIVVAALVGALSPFCSCGVIPLIAALLAIGVPLPAVMAFWLASPIMDPAMFVLTSGTLGLGFAVFKTFAAASIGLLGGFGTMALLQAGLLGEPLRPGIGGSCGARRLTQPGPVAWRFWQEPARRATFVREAGSTTFFLGKWLTLAFVLESLMLAWVPAELVTSIIGGDGWWPVLVATVVGVPAYLNGFAALPLVDGLLDQGMAPGAAMAFLIAGGVSCIPAAVAVWALARPPVFAAYVGFAFTGALAMGLLFGLLA